MSGLDVETVVVGGGLAGLLTAVELQRRGNDVVLFEASQEPGGIARTVESDGFRLEPAVGSMLLPGPHLGRILDHAGVASAPAPAARTRYLFTGDRLEAVEPSPAMLTSRLLSGRAKLRLFREPFVKADPGGDESLLELCVRRFGSEAGTLIADVMATGVFAGDAASLSPSAAFPSLADLERASGSVLRGGIEMRRRRGGARATTHVPVGGMAALIDRLASTLGDRAYLGAAVASIRRGGRGWVVEGAHDVTARRVVLALPPDIVAALLDTELAPGPGHAPVDVVWLGWRLAEATLPVGYGYISTSRSGHATLGCLFESASSAVAAPAGMALVKTIVGGTRRPDVATMDDGAVTALVTREVTHALGIDPAIDFTHVIRHRPGIPQYDIGHERWLDDVEAALPDGLHLAGWSYRGIGIARLAEDAGKIADEVAS